jgi:ribose transport system substrate-binding protein
MEHQMKQSIKALVGIVAVSSVLVMSGVSASAATSGAKSAVSNAVSAKQAAAAAAVVAKVSAPINKFVAPGAAVKNVKSFAGKTVYYIPATLTVPLFSIQETGLKAAFGAVGAQLKTCDAKSNPQDLATCLGQAVDAKAAAVVIGSLPVAMAPTAFQAVVDAHIPLVITLVGAGAMQGDGKDYSDLSKVGYLTQNGVEIQAWNANAVIADSKARANVLAIEVTDTEATKAWTEYGALGTYKAACSACKTTVIQTTTGTIDKVASLVSAKLVADPTIKYVQVPFDGFVQPVQQGIQSAGRTDVKIVSGDGYLDVLQGMKAKKQVIADTAFNVFATGWYAADQVLRLATGSKAVANEVFPLRRMITPTNVKTLDLTAKGQADGSWFGKADYINGFLKLWGLK